MPVSTTMLAPADTPTTAHLTPTTTCTNCRECGSRVSVGGTSVLYWPVQLDQDLLQTISSLFPHWFKDCNLNDMSKMSDSPRRIGVGGRAGGGGSGPSAFIPLSPPKCEVDDSPLQGKTLNKNKESLKVKLMLRRPREDLVSRGVIPPMNTPAAFYEQRQRLDMAKKHDILKHKMQRRPLREELVRQHILEDSPGNIDPSLVEKQKQLKRARIADTISDHLCQRPGPLELVKANILHTTEDLEKAVKEGQLMFKSTSEGEPRKHPSLYLSYEDDSSSEGGLSPEQGEIGGSLKESAVSVHCQSSTPTSALASISTPTVLHATPSPLPTPALIAPSSALFSTSSGDVPPSPSLASNTSSLSPLSSLASPQHSFIPSPQTPLPQTLLVTQTPLPHALTTPPLQNSAPGKDQSKGRKKSKGKSQPKTRTIKFHEYKGPPSAAKREHSSPTETSYDILLQQQQLFLQCQLELKQKYTQIILPAALKTTSSDLSPGVTLSSVLTLASTPSPSSTTSTSVALAQAGNTPIAPAPPNHSSTPPAPPPPPTPPDLASKHPNKLEDLKVSDLKLELKKRNLPVSGSKPQLIERLRFHSKTFGNSKPLSSGSCSSASTPHASVSSPSTNSGTSCNVSKEPSLMAITTPLPSQSSLDSTDDASVMGLFESSMEMCDDSVVSPAYSHISSTRPSSAAPMDVDLNSALDASDLGSLTPLNPPLTPLDGEGGSINTPPPPPPPPPPPVPRTLSTSPNTCESVLTKANMELRSLVSSSPAPTLLNGIPTPVDTVPIPTNPPENQEGILHLKKKIEDLQKELINTQLQLQQQQKHNMLKAQENFKKNICDPKFNQKAILQHHIDSKKQQQQQQQLQSHLLQLQQNLQNEQKQLERDSNHDAINDLDDLIIIHSNNVSPFRSEAVKSQQNHYLELQQYQQHQQPNNIQDHNQQQNLHYQSSQHQKEHKNYQILDALPSSEDEKPKPCFHIRDLPVKMENGWHHSLDASITSLQKNHRPNPIIVPNGIIINTHHRTSSLPNFSGLVLANGAPTRTLEDNQVSISCQTTDCNAREPPPPPLTEESIKGHGLQPVEAPQEFSMRPPPNYIEATKHSKASEPVHRKPLNQSSRKPSYKSQQVDDVLEILIKNGELPPSAAQEPVTPTTPQRESNPPLFLPVEPHSPSIPPPPPPPPPPSVSSSHKQGLLPPPSSSAPCSSWGSGQCTQSSPAFAPISSPSLFADLVMEGGSPAHLGLHLDLNLPVFEGMDLGPMDAPFSSEVDGEQRCHDPRRGPPLGGEIKMEVGEDVDVASWLDSLAPPTLPPSSHAHLPPWATENSTQVLGPPHYGGESTASSGVSSLSSSTNSHPSSGCSFSLNQGGDPLLGCNPDQMGPFYIEDMDLRPPHTASDLSWDRLDFPT